MNLGGQLERGCVLEPRLSYDGKRIVFSYVEVEGKHFDHGKILTLGTMDELARLGGDTGRVYAWNTWGNVAGALLAGLVLLPALGMEHLLRGAALGSGALGFLAIGLFSPKGRAPWIRMGAAVALDLHAGQPAVLDARERPPRDRHVKPNPRRSCAELKVESGFDDRPNPHPAAARKVRPLLAMRW